MKKIILLIFATISLGLNSQNLTDIESELIEINNQGSITNITDTIEYQGLCWLKSNDIFVRYYFPLIVETKFSNDLLYRYVMHQPFLIKGIIENNNLYNGKKLIIYVESHLDSIQGYRIDFIYDNEIIDEPLLVESGIYSGNIVDFGKGLEYIIEKNNIQQYNIIGYYSMIENNIYYSKIEIILN